MGSKFSRTRNKRQKPPHCKPGVVYAPPYLPYFPGHITCIITHEITTPTFKTQFSFRPWDYPAVPAGQYRWERKLTVNSVYEIYYHVRLESRNNFETFDLSVTIVSTPPPINHFRNWFDQLPMRVNPLKAGRREDWIAPPGIASKIWVSVHDTGKPNPPPQPGNYGPY